MDIQSSTSSAETSSVTFAISAIDLDGDRVSYRIADLTTSGIVPPTDPSSGQVWVSIDGETGRVTADVTGHEGIWALQVRLTSSVCSSWVIATILILPNNLFRICHLTILPSRSNVTHCLNPHRTRLEPTLKQRDTYRVLCSVFRCSRTFRRSIGFSLKEMCRFGFPFRATNFDQNHKTNAEVIS